MSDDDAIVKSRLEIRVMAANQEMRTVSFVVEYEQDPDAEPEDRIICSVAEFSVVVTGPDMKLAGARMESLVREQIARMKASGMFRRWVEEKLKVTHAIDCDMDEDCSCGASS